MGLGFGLKIPVCAHTGLLEMTLSPSTCFYHKKFSSKGREILSDRKDYGAREEKFEELVFCVVLCLFLRRMEVKSRKPFFFNKALLEHREQVLQRQRLAPPCVLPVHKSLPFIGIYILSFFLSLFLFITQMLSC